MYRFIIGGSGSGKTYKAFTDCISASEGDEGSRFLLIVPEQATTETEKEIIKMHPRHATDRIDVLSFNRLAYRVFDELGIVNPEVLDDISKAIILRRLLIDHEDELKAWKGRYIKPGFVDNLKSMISEMYQYGITELPLSDTYSVRLNNKLHDLNLIFGAFKEYTSGRYIALEEIPDILSRNIYKSKMFKGTHVILDGFTGFTPIQYRIIESILVNAKDVTVTVSMGEDRDNALFDMGRTVIDKITDLASKNGISHDEDICLTADSFLEKHLLRYDGAMTSGDGNICLTCAHDIAEEVRYVAGSVERNVKLEGYRYRDIAVITTDGESYGDDIRHEFDLAGIPHYEDSSIGLSDNALTQLIMAALDVMHSDYSYDSFMRYLRTGLVSDDKRIIDICDNYMYEYGRRGYKRMREDWVLADKYDAGLNGFKNEIMAGLEILRSGVDGSDEVAERDNGKCGRAARLRRLCEYIGAEAKLAEMSDGFAEAGERELAREYELCYESIMSVLDRTEELLCGEDIDDLEFAQILTAGISQKKLGMIPTGVDKVTIGDLTRTRLEHIKILYVLGANEGKIPKVLNRNSVISDAEKNALKAGGIKLSPTIKEDLYIQRYYLYRVLTKPEDRLCISYALSDNEGAAMGESYIIGHLKSLYEGLGVSRTKDAVRISEARARLKNAALIMRACGFNYDPEKLDKENADELYGDELYSSITRLEKFSECPYQYFLRYGLGLNEIKKFSFEAVDIGNLAHAALEKVFVNAKKNGKDPVEADDKERDQMVNEAIAQAVKDDPTAKFNDTASNSYLVSRLTRIVKRSLWGIAKGLKDDGFTPYDFECEFDSLRTRLDNGKVMTLNGKIDRIDIKKDSAGMPAFDGDSGVGLRIVDYKTGSKKWDWNELLNSHDLQLALYMEAARQILGDRFRTEVVPEEMYYYHIQDPMLEGEKLSADSDLEAAMLSQMKPSGLDNSHQIEVAIANAKKNSVRIGNEIFGGEIAIKPRKKDNGTSCTYCSYRAVCGFDKKLPGFDYAKEKKYSKDDITEILKGDSDGNNA